MTTAKTKTKGGRRQGSTEPTISKVGFDERAYFKAASGERDPHEHL
jgi:hypothetical protein